MRVNLTAQSPDSQRPVRATDRISLTMRPACGLPGDYSYTTDSASLLRMLRQKTELRSSVLERFEQELQISKCARLLGVEMSEKALTEIGYFID